MLEQNDLQKIGQEIEKVIKNDVKPSMDKLREDIRDEFGKVVEQNVMPAIDDLRKDMATKEDIKEMATKEDIKEMATKKDLGQLKHEIFDHMDDKLSDLRGDLVVLMRSHRLYRSAQITQI